MYQLWYTGVMDKDEDKMILLHGFVKKSQKTPQNELDTARRRLNNVEKD
jgi:phage-related protein